MRAIDLSTVGVARLIPQPGPGETACPKAALNLQARALEEGIPYLTLAASLLHKYVNGQLVNHR